MFQKATKYESKLRLAIAGPSGSGKTFTALAVGTALATSGRVAVVDTEHGSASKYAEIFSFDVVNLDPPFHPDRFGEAIQAAASAGYEVIILDSLSHAWSGTGGLLDIVDGIARRMKSSNSFAAWKDATPIQNALIEAIVGARIHVIATMRSKQEYVLEQVERNGRYISVPKKVGMAPIQRDSFEYEFDVYLDMDTDNSAVVNKTRCPALAGRVIAKPGKDLASILREWLSGEPLKSPRTAVLPVQATQATPEPENAPAGNSSGARELLESLEEVENKHGVGLKQADWETRPGNGDIRRETSPQAQKAREHLRPTAETPAFNEGDEVMVGSKDDEKPGTVTAVKGDSIFVRVDGKILKTSPDKLVLVNPLF